MMRQNAHGGLKRTEAAPRFGLRSVSKVFAIVFVVVLLLIASRSNVPVASAQGVPPVTTSNSSPTSTYADSGDVKIAKIKPDAPLTEDNEIKIGRANAEENDKHIRIVTDAAMVERVNRIGQELAAVANSVTVPALYGSSNVKQFHYKFTIVDDKDVNAYSLPGGYIYVNKGLIDYIHSDDELAGVLAHEISHAAHHHMMKLIREQAKMQNIIMPALLLAGLAMHGGVGNLPQAMIAGNLYITAKVNTYSVEAEKDADHCGMMFMTHTHFNPAGLYSVMIRLAADERNSVHPDMGIYQTHPPGEERVAAARKVLEDLHLPIDLSEVDPTRIAQVSVVKATATAPEMADMTLNGVLLCRVVGADGDTAAQRAQKISRTLGLMMDTMLQAYEIRLTKDKTHILVRDKLILNQADALAQGKTMEALKQMLSDALLVVYQKRMLSSGL